MSDLAKTETGITTTDAKDPLLMLPKEWRRPVGFFFAAHSDILKGKLALVTKIRYWIKEDGLTLDELRGIFKRLLSPEVCAGIQYVGQLHAVLAEAVAAAEQERERHERIKHQVRQREEVPACEDLGGVLERLREKAKGMVRVESVNGEAVVIPETEAPGF